MNCPRCGTMAEHNEFGHGEFEISCFTCGYYHKQSISAFCGDQPIYENNILTPLGVIVTPKGNYQYYTLRQRNIWLDKPYVSGYTYFNGKEWKYQKLSQPEPVSLMELI